MEIVSSFVKMGFLRFWQFNWLMRLGQKMTCSGCEARREWIKQNLQRAERKRKLLLQWLAGQRNDSNESGITSGNQGPERGDVTNHGPEQ